VDVEFESADKVAKISCEKVINKKMTQNRVFIFFYCVQKFSGSNLFVVNFKQFFRVFRLEGFPIKTKIGFLILALLQT
jgi:hypothetical protein